MRRRAGCDCRFASRCGIAGHPLRPPAHAFTPTFYPCRNPIRAGAWIFLAAEPVSGVRLPLARRPTKFDARSALGHPPDICGTEVTRFPQRSNRALRALFGNAEQESTGRLGIHQQRGRDWLRANPEQAQEVMRRNRRFTFFRIIQGEGPIGGHGVPLTPGRSLAVDPAYLPLGAPIWLDTSWPGDNAPLRRLMVAQDIGGAIKGPVRGDFFWGYGEEALHYAGRMKQMGRYFLLLPKAVARRYEVTG